MQVYVWCALSMHGVRYACTLMRASMHSLVVSMHSTVASMHNYAQPCIPHVKVAFDLHSDAALGVGSWEKSGGTWALYSAGELLLTFGGGGVV